MSDKISKAAAKYSIHKAGGVFIKDRKFLTARSRGKSFFIAPGGKLEEGETAPEALVRELEEELQVVVHEKDLTLLGTFHAIAAGKDDTQIQMDVFVVEKWDGDIIPSAEIEEVKWIDSHLPEGFELGSIFHHEVLPRLKERDLID